ncbi:MAG: DMT family transporter [Candidatus Marinimicrobia bacterium]|nr:DMT family transporter [Candidatus Neomarinimicrobiota bacterium]MDP6853309.1 DMT family transporter [Candidatus Neomarinimicrobiota bacterium]
MKYRLPLLLSAAMFAVSTSPIIARYLAEVPAVAISFWRMAIGASILWLWSSANPQQSLTPKQRNRTILAGFFLGIHFALFFAAIKLTTIANATFLGTLAPVFTFFIEKYFFKRQHTRGMIFGLAVAITGAFIIVANQFNFSSNFTLGNILALLCSLFIAMAFIISENVRKSTGTISYSRTLFTSAAITLIGISIITNDPLTGFSAREFGGLFLLGLIPTIFGHGIMYHAVGFASPTIVTSAPLGEPVIATIFAYFLFSEPVGFSVILGGGFTLLGLLILIRNKG